MTASLPLVLGPQAFLVAGARCLLVSAWEVGDRATALLMDAFDAAMLDDGPPPGEALARARVALREHVDGDGRRPFAHPASWAAFTLVGAAD